jgi:hypothetical protein
MDHGAHIFVCGDCKMAEDVYQTFQKIAQFEGKMTEAEAENYMLSLRVKSLQEYLIRVFLLSYSKPRVHEFLITISQDDNRYHEDIFGILPKKGTRQADAPLLVSETISENKPLEEVSKTQANSNSVI